MSTQVSHNDPDDAVSSSPRRRPGLVNLILLVVVVLMAIGASLLLVSQNSALHRAQQDRQTAQDELDSRSTAVETVQDEQIHTALGADPKRMDDDAVVIDRLAEQIGTWDSGASYEQARADLIDELGMSDDDPFFVQFMPPAASNVDGNGDRTYYLDVMGIDSSVSDTTIGLESVMADKYRYTVVVDTDITSEAVDSSSSPDGSDSTSGLVLLELTINSNGIVTDLDGAASSGVTRTS